ncbi:MAG TPA: O-acetyl-ADP-ribose deacetylase [Dehalococcoidia bacterium]|nr:O-acetyl-ADP-ribose deacetylase [Dehalococcoidia bacterium]
MSTTKEIDIGGKFLKLMLGDITGQDTDAIVNAANSGLMGGGGVDGAIHRAGGQAILEECKKIVSRIGRLETGKAVITTGGNLKARFVIHTVGPVWRGGMNREPELLASAYRECLKLATGYKLKRISFPSISTGIYGYPVEMAAKIAIKEVISFLKDTPTPLEEVIFVLFDSRTLSAYQKALEHSIP